MKRYAGEISEDGTWLEADQPFTLVGFPDLGDIRSFPTMRDFALFIMARVQMNDLHAMCNALYEFKEGKWERVRISDPMLNAALDGETSTKEFSR
jgi:hypothetical protein